MLSRLGKDKERKNEGKVLSTTLDIELHFLWCGCGVLSSRCLSHL